MAQPAGLLTPAEARAKVIEYEAFVAERLQPDLRSALDALDTARAELADFLSLRAQLESMVALVLGARPKLRVSLGADFFVRAQADDADAVCVHVGLGFFAQLTRAEALHFVAQKERALDAQIEALQARAATVRAHVQVLLDAIAELSGQRLAASR
jgi:prefoldin alpha subunit